MDVIMGDIRGGIQDSVLSARGWMLCAAHQASKASSVSRSSNSCQLASWPRVWSRLLKRL